MEIQDEEGEGVENGLLRKGSGEIEGSKIEK